MQDDPDNLDRLIDQAINDVARGMTGARVDEGFARRVSARLEDPDARVSRSWPRAWLLVPAASVLLLAAFAVLDRRDVNVRVQPDATTGTASGLTAQGSGLSQAQPSALSSPSALSPEPSRRRPQPWLRPTAAAVPSADVEVIAPIDVDRIDVSPLVTAMPIEIASIAIDRIDIAPMF